MALYGVVPTLLDGLLPFISRTTIRTHWTASCLAGATIAY